MDAYFVVCVALCAVLSHALAANYTINDCPVSAPHNSHLKVFRDSCYSFITSQQREFGAAERQCESHLGQLVIIRDAETQIFIYNELRHEFRYNGIVWIGLTDQVSEGHFVWVDGSPAVYTNWMSGQPGRVGSLEDCAVMDISEEGQWGDYPCSGILFLSQSHVFVCEYPITNILQPTLPATTTDIAGTVIATAAPPSCVQCGNQTDDTGCTDDEMNQADTQCEAGLDLCMIDIYRDSAESPVQYYKRCADRRSCDLEWYQPSLQDDYCVHLHQQMPDILVCHICCQGPACNNGTLPAADTLFKP